MTAPSPSPEEVDAACVAARVPGRGLSRMDMVAALEAAAEVREAAAEARGRAGFVISEEAYAELLGREAEPHITAPKLVEMLRSGSERLSRRREMSSDERRRAATRILALRDRLQVEQDERERRAKR